MVACLAVVERLVGASGAHAEVAAATGHARLASVFDCRVCAGGLPRAEEAADDIYEAQATGGTLVDPVGPVQVRSQDRDWTLPMGPTETIAMLEEETADAVPPKLV